MKSERISTAMAITWSLRLEGKRLAACNKRITLAPYTPPPFECLKRVPFIAESTERFLIYIFPRVAA